MALPTAARKPFTSLRPFAVSAKVTLFCASTAGFPGAWFQCRSSSVETSTAASGSDTSGASGKLTGSISGTCVAAISRTRLYSSPDPTTCAVTPASRAIVAARSTSSISSATNSAGCLPPMTVCSASHARLVSGRSTPWGARA